LVPWKGFATLIETIKKLSEEINDLRLVIVGDGPDRSVLADLAKINGLERSIIFTGQLSKHEVAAYMKAADLFVLNTAYEGLSHVLIEAIRAGLPIVTTSVGGNPELIEKYARGVMVTYDDKPELAEAIKLARVTAGQVSGAENLLAQFDYDFMISRISELLKNRLIFNDAKTDNQGQDEILTDCDHRTIALIQINFSQDHSETVLPLGILSVGSHLKRCGHKVELINITEKQIDETAAVIAEKNRF